MGKFRKCLLCDVTKTSDSRLSFHGFPSNPKIRSLWMKACNLNEETDCVSSRHVVLCSNHFKSTDYIGNRVVQTGKTPRLRFGAVPSIWIPNAEMPVNNFPSISTNSSNAMHEADNTDIAAASGENLNQCLAYNMSTLGTNEDNVISVPTTPTANRVRMMPRYLGDLKEDDFSTPQRRAYNLRLVKNTVRNHKMKIRRLQDQKRRLLKKIKTLNEFVYHLKKRHLLSDDATDF